MITPIEALKAQGDTAGTGSLMLQSRSANATFYFRDSKIYALFIKSQSPTVRQRLKWSLHPNIHKAHIYETIVSTPDLEIGKVLLKHDYVPLTVITEIAYDHFLQLADEVLLSWGKVQSTWTEGEFIEDIPGVTIPPMSPEELLKRVDERIKRIQGFANWLKIDMYEVGSITVGAGNAEPRPTRDAEKLVTELSNRSPSLIELMKEAGGIGMSQIVSAVYRSYQADAISIYLNNRKLEPEKTNIQSGIAKTILPASQIQDTQAPEHSEIISNSDKNSGHHADETPTPRQTPALVSPTRPSTPEEKPDSSPEPEILTTSAIESEPISSPTPEINDVTEELLPTEETEDMTETLENTEEDDVDALLKKLEALLPKLESKHEKVVEEVMALRQSINDQNAQREDITKERTEIAEYISGAQSQIKEIQSHITNLEGQLNEAQGRLEAINNNVSERESRDQDLSARERHFSDSLQESMDLLAEKEKEEADLKSKIMRLSH